MSETNIGFIGWAGIATGVVLWDALAEQTLSAYYHERVQDPRTRALALGAVAVVATHLVRPDVLSQFDPITRFGAAVRQFTRP